MFKSTIRGDSGRFVLVGAHLKAQSEVIRAIFVFTVVVAELPVARRGAGAAGEVPGHCRETATVLRNGHHHKHKNTALERSES